MQLSMPPSPLEPPGPVEQMFLFSIAYLLLLALVLLALPQKWTRRIVQIAFRLRGDSIDAVAAQELLRAFAREADDATVVVVKSAGNLAGTSDSA